MALQSHECIKERKRTHIKLCGLSSLFAHQWHLNRALYKSPSMRERGPVGIPQGLLCVNVWILRGYTCRGWGAGWGGGSGEGRAYFTYTPTSQSIPRMGQKISRLSKQGQPLRIVLSCGQEPCVYPPTVEAATEDCSGGCVCCGTSGLRLLAGTPSKWVFTILPGVQTMLHLLLLFFSFIRGISWGSIPTW